jgi:mRNA interferase MazF
MERVVISGGRFARGDVVVIPFPFSDLTQSKRRPALVIAASGREDFILCQITSKTVKDGTEIPIDDPDFREGSLKQPSNVRPNRLFTASDRIMLYKVGSLNAPTMQRVTDRLVKLVRGEA